MSTLNQLRQGLSKAWDTVTEGWRELHELASDALTRFQPKTTGGDVDTAQDRITARASRWGLLAAEVAANEDSIEVTLEVPGLEASDFKVEVHDDLLVVRGEKKLVRKKTEGHYHIMERAYGQFERAIRLPVPVEDDGARANYRNGVLTVSLPKSHSARARRIRVES